MIVPKCERGKLFCTVWIMHTGTYGEGGFCWGLITCSDGEELFLVEGSRSQHRTLYNSRRLNLPTGAFAVWALTCRKLQSKGIEQKPLYWEGPKGARCYTEQKSHSQFGAMDRRTATWWQGCAKDIVWKLFINLIERNVTHLSYVFISESMQPK